MIDEHSKKANFIVNNMFAFPNEIFEQSEIFNHQKQKFIVPYNKVAVLASFPLFLLDYYGIEYHLTHLKKYSIETGHWQQSEAI